MANQVGMIAMYDLLGFSTQASEILYTDQGTDELVELSIMPDVEVESLCKLVCMPGRGVNPQPARSRCRSTRDDQYPQVYDINEGGDEFEVSLLLHSSPRQNEL